MMYSDSVTIQQVGVVVWQLFLSEEAKTRYEQRGIAAQQKERPC
jgi:hypothetical protein